ncbi:SpoIIE family protein phosphatase [Sedimentibacter sp. MB31-C6]|uniref:SpoIIE family protein phosphatase n=1 Tax=Sedimentibacter sp. MB31-C6 TaxID=3109366 RepID=UPI002DDC99F4|nr:SpoIIE family protein phosphatase [Sedimentibacter sp. MB36-C1]WSI03428.1 SpoIIE family protein phosphatase [Sedimentibacter sp. MB36-C1]
MGLYSGHIKKEQLSIVDGMIDWVRVIDKDNKVYYANKKMKEDLGEDIIGKKCYDVFCRDTKCENCISHKTLMDGSIFRKEEVLNNKTYMVVASPMYNELGEIVGSVEVFRDITNEKKLTKSVNEKNKKMSDDIAFARNMQKRMLPPKGIYNGINVDYLYESSELLSGDFFDVFKIDKDNTGIYICDVVGHGVTASLLTIFVRQSLRTISKGDKSIDFIMKELHKSFLALNLDYDKYFSIFCGKYNKTTGDFEYINAGHNSVPFLLNKEKSLISLESKGYPICNIFDNVDYDNNKINLKTGDKLFFYTDGIPEAKNELGQEFGTEKLIEIIKTENDILNKIKVSLENYSKVQKDDYAILMAEII